MKADTERKTEVKAPDGVKNWPRKLTPRQVLELGRNVPGTFVIFRGCRAC